MALARRPAARVSGRRAARAAAAAAAAAAVLVRCAVWGLPFAGARGPPGAGAARPGRGRAGAALAPHVQARARGGQHSFPLPHASRGPSPELLAAAEQLAWAAGEDLPQDVRWSEERCSGFIAGWVAANGPMPPSQSGWGLAQDRRGGPARRGERFGAPPAPARAGSAHPAGGDVPDLVRRNPELWKPFVRFVDTRTVMPSPPTEKQLAYAHALAQEVGFQVPGKARENAMACSELISDLEAVRRPRPPTEKQLAFAHELAQQADIKVPDEVREDIAACGEFLDRLKAARWPRPTEKQLAFAQELAQQAGIKVPDEVREDFAACSEFIERLNAAREPRPTEKQLAFAQELAQLAGIKVPDEVREDFAACREFIERLNAARWPRRGPGPPTEKQLAFAHELAQQADIKVPDEVREDFAACREFLDRLKAAQGPNAARAAPLSPFVQKLARGVGLEPA